MSVNIEFVRTARTGVYEIVAKADDGEVVAHIALTARDANRINRQIVKIIIEDDAELSRAEGAYEQWQMGSGR